MSVKFQEEQKNTKMPTENKVGYDVYIQSDTEISSGRNMTLKLGFSIPESPEVDGYFFELFITEKLGRDGLILSNGVGILIPEKGREITMSVFTPLNDPCSYENRNVILERGDIVGQIIPRKIIKL